MLSSNGMSSNRMEQLYEKLKHASNQSNSFRLEEILILASSKHSPHPKFFIFDLKFELSWNKACNQFCFFLLFVNVELFKAKYTKHKTCWQRILFIEVYLFFFFKFSNVHFQICTESFGKRYFFLLDLNLKRKTSQQGRTNVNKIPIR